MQILDLLTNFALGTLYPIWKILAAAETRLYWVYVLSGLAIAYVLHRASGEKRAFSEILFDRAVWSSASARNDLLINVINPALQYSVLTWAFLNARLLTQWMVDLLHWAGVNGAATGSAALALGGLLTVTLFLVNDLLRWLVHYWFHCVPALWAFHKVHHSAEHLNFFTADRLHPIELILESMLLVVPTAAVNALFIAAFGEHLTVATVAGANIIYFASNLIGGVLRHSPFWVSFGPRVERWLISPAMHQIHHSENPKHFDKNLGGALAVWDRMFGTLYIPQGKEEIRYGIGPETRQFRSLSALYLKPFRDAAGQILSSLARADRQPQGGTGPQGSKASSGRE